MANTIICVLAGFLLLAGIEARSTEKPDAIEKGPTCVYNGVEYDEGAELPTRGRCWHCDCRPGFEKPGPEFCARISCPDYGDNGCEPVYSEEECCPVAWNCDSSNVTEPRSCDERYFQHYKIKQCVPVLEEGSDCPVRFDCPATFLTDNSVCYHKDKTYKVKESIPSDNPCLMCTCESSPDIGADIMCISIECPSAFSPKLYREGCYPTYSMDSCCSIGEACDDPSNGTASEPLCEVDGKLYHSGQHMYLKDEPCLTCLCDENWVGVSNASCRRSDCMLESKLKLLKDGCLPIYHESTCCPIEFYCESSDEQIIPGASFAADSVPDPLKQCVFKDKRGNLGDVLKLNRSNNCVTCTCSTPPEFTCVYRKCPNPPNDDYENCKSIYTPGECCAKYECVQQAPSLPVCDPVYCPEGCTEIMVPYGCPMCSCEKILCSPPACGSDCVIDYTAKPCPACRCAETIPLDRPMCGPVKCGPQCHEAISPQGCPMCVCGPLCSPPKCQSGCHVVTDVTQGQCPYCVCEQEPDIETTLPDRAHKVLCSPVRCPPDCSEATGENGCSMCLCEPLCSPPLCNPGCRMEVVPSSGPCPGCVCDQSITDALHCSPVKCPLGCTEYVPPHSCPICKCEKVLCSMPKCPSGCEVNYDPTPGTCPDCKCPETIPLDRPLCAPVKCGPGCYEGISPQGCPMCVCGPLCSPPKCDPGCQLQKYVPEGQCPGCECPGVDAVSDRAFKVICAPVRCPLDCREAEGPNGCPICMCDPLCSPPKCGPGCRAEIAPSSGPCPGCVCDQVEKPHCDPIYCGPDCYESVSPQGCPTCICGPQCSPPRCPPGCIVERNVLVGHCPGCDCSSARPPNPEPEPGLELAPDECAPGCRAEQKDGELQCMCDPLCSIPQCPPECTLKMDVPRGTCPYCDCPSDIPTFEIGGKDDPLKLCSPPKCDPGCSVQKNVPIGTCPACECPTVGRKVAFSAPMMSSPTPVQCLPGCNRVIGTNGVARCVCSPICAIPRCPSSCTIRQILGACPTCDCAKREEVRCPDMPCQLPCRWVRLSPNTCPMCECGTGGLRDAGFLSGAEAPSVTKLGEDGVGKFFKG